MNEASTTWALVVGIDQYDDPAIRPLRGPVADAVAAVKWLRKLGVGDERIFLHASPSKDSQLVLDSLQLAYKPADETSIWGSVTSLRKVKDGTRLFIFLSGHGLYDPQTRRLFLTQEAGPEMGYANLGMDEYIELFRSMVFERQYLFLDGCQNYPYSERVRPTIKAAMKSGVTGYTARPGNTLIACYAAGQDEQAVDQIDGHGALSRFLFEAIDPEKPWSPAIDLDFVMGARTLNLRRLMENYLCPTVAKAAADQRPTVTQNPVIVPLGRETDASRRMFRLKDLPTALLELTVVPEAAGPDVQKVSITVDQDGSGEPLDWEHRLPSPPARTISFPVARRIPVGLEVQARWTLRLNASWMSGSTSRVTVDRDRIVPLQMIPQPIVDVPRRGQAVAERGTGPTRSSPETTFHIRTYGQDGNIAYNAINYDQLPGKLGKELIALRKVKVIRNEHGPDLVVRSKKVGNGVQIAEAYAEAIQRMTPARVGVSLLIPAPSRRMKRPNLRLILPLGGAVSLAGAIAGEEGVQIGGREAEGEPERRGRTVSLASLEVRGAFWIEPGPTWVHVTLPWGHWTQLIQVPQAGEARVELPEFIGMPPLRVPLYSESRRRTTLVLGMEGDAPSGRVERGLYDSGASVPLVKAEPGRAAWALRPKRKLKGAPLGGGLVTLEVAEGRRISYPLLENRVVALDRTGGGLRAEPLSAIKNPAWDKLVTSGRLESLSSQEAGELLANRKSEWLLIVAVAYTLYASHAKFQESLFKKALRSLNDLARTRKKKGGSIPDIDLLRIALAVRAQDLRADVLEEPKPGWFQNLKATESLRLWARTGSVPVFRWGVPLALHLLTWAGDEEPFASWREALAGIAPHLSPLSVWTVWTDQQLRP